MQHEASRRPSGRSGLLAALQLVLLVLQLSARDVTGLKLHLPPGASGGQLVMNEGDTLVLSCEDSDDIRLSLPPFSLADQTLPEIVHRRTGSLWNATLVLRGVRPAHTGYYNCTSMPNRLDMDTVYVYVRSKARDRPWVLDSDDMRQKQMVSQYSAHLHTTATLDCRANDPTISVRLRDGKNHTLSLGRQSDGTELSWNPRIGFLLGPVEMRHSGSYWCAADGINRDLQVKLQVVGVDLVPPTVWLDREAPSVARGADVTILCELAMVRRIDFNLTWTSPTGRANEGYRWVSYGAVNDSNSWHRRTKLLYIFNVKDSDAGDYTCTADDGRGNRRSATFRLEVQGAPVRETAKTAAPTSATGHKHQGQQGNKGHGSSGGSNLNAGAGPLILATFLMLLAPVTGKLRGCS